MIGQTNRHYNFIYRILAWEPSAAEVTKVTPAVYPHLNDFTGKLNFRYKS